MHLRFVSGFGPEDMPEAAAGIDAEREPEPAAALAPEDTVAELVVEALPEDIAECTPETAAAPEQDETAQMFAGTVVELVVDDNHIVGIAAGMGRILGTADSIAGTAGTIAPGWELVMQLVVEK